MDTVLYILGVCAFFGVVYYIGWVWFPKIDAKKAAAKEKDAPRERRTGEPHSSSRKARADEDEKDQL